MPQQFYFCATEENPFLVKADAKKSHFSPSQQASPFPWPPGGQNATQRGRKREMVTGLGAEGTQARARHSATELTWEGKLPPGVWVICTDVGESTSWEQCPAMATMFIDFPSCAGNVSVLQVSSSSPTTILLLSPLFQVRKIRAQLVNIQHSIKVESGFGL